MYFTYFVFKNIFLDCIMWETRFSSSIFLLHSPRVKMIQLCQRGKECWGGRTDRGRWDGEPHIPKMLGPPAWLWGWMPIKRRRRRRRDIFVRNLTSMHCLRHNIPYRYGWTNNSTKLKKKLLLQYCRVLFLWCSSAWFFFYKILQF